MLEEPDPQRTIHNKNNISKVMFLTAVARPRFDEDEDEKVLFDGKLGVWAFVTKTPAKNNSKNRPKGIIELKSLVVTRDMMREYLLEKVIPAIHAQWPDDNEIIFIQHDNSRTHVKGDDLAFQSAVKESGLDIQLVQQAPNSPDTNALDLGFFSSIQSLTLLDAPNILKEFIQSIE
jgi:hypothetical protein